MAHIIGGADMPGFRFCSQSDRRPEVPPPKERAMIANQHPGPLALQDIVPPGNRNEEPSSPRGSALEAPLGASLGASPLGASVLAAFASPPLGASLPAALDAADLSGEATSSQLQPPHAQPKAANVTDMITKMQAHLAGTKRAATEAVAVARKKKKLVKETAEKATTGAKPAAAKKKAETKKKPSSPPDHPCDKKSILYVGTKKKPPRHYGCSTIYTASEYWRLKKNKGDRYEKQFRFNGATTKEAKETWSKLIDEVMAAQK